MRKRLFFKYLICKRLTDDRYIERAKGKSIKVKNVAASATNFLTPLQIGERIDILLNQVQEEKMV